MRRLLCHYGYTNIAIFSTNDDVGTGQLQNFLKDLKGCPINVLESQVFSVNTIVFDDAIGDMLKSGAKIFVAFMTVKTFAPLLEQGYASGLFGEETQVFGNCLVSKQALLSTLQPTTDIASVMKGFIGMEYWPSYALAHTETGQAFMRRWVKQPYTGPDSKGLCKDARDDAAVNFLYRDAFNKTICYGLNFSTYSLDGSDLSPYAALTYDATILMLSGYHDIISKKKTLNSSAVVQSMRNTSFEGVSGFMSMAEQNGQIYTYDNNIRATGVYYKIINFDYESYMLSSDAAALSSTLTSSAGLSASQGFQQVLFFSSEEGIQGCSGAMACNDVVYRSSSNTPPSDTRPTIIVELSEEMRGLLIALGTILLLMAIGVMVFLYIYRESKLIKASQGPVMYFIVLGEIFGGARVINAALDITDDTCIAGIWAGHLAFFLVFGCLFLKCWRIDRLVNSESLKRIRITTLDVLKILFGILTVVVIYLIILTLVGQPHQSSLTSTSSNQTTEKYHCAFEHAELHTALFAMEAAVLAYGVKVCWATKNVPDAVNEAKYVAFGKLIYAMVWNCLSFERFLMCWCLFFSDHVYSDDLGDGLSDRLFDQFGTCDAADRCFLELRICGLCHHSYCLWTEDIFSWA
jgi:hypothetical protein